MARDQLSVTQAAQTTGIPRRTLLYAIQVGHLKAHKLGAGTSAYVINQTDLDRYVASRHNL